MTPSRVTWLSTTTRLICVPPRLIRHALQGWSTSGRRSLPQLHQPQEVSRRVTEGGVDAVRAVLRRLNELDPAGCQLFERGRDVVALEQHGSGEPLRHQPPQLLG